MKASFLDLLFGRSLFGNKTPQRGSIEYVRLSYAPELTGLLIDGRVVFLSPGGALDLVVSTDHRDQFTHVRFPETVSATLKTVPALNATIFRFKVPREAAVGDLLYFSFTDSRGLTPRKREFGIKVC